MRIIFALILYISSLFAVQVQELSWPKGETFLTFLEKYNISQNLYFELEKEYKELCSEINAGIEYNLLLNDDGSLNQVLIPVSEDIQLHIFKNKKDKYEFEAIPIAFEEVKETIIIEIERSPFQDILKATNNLALANEIMRVYGKSINFRGIHKGDIVAVKYKQKTRLGKYFGNPEILASLIEVNGRKNYRFKNRKNDKYYDEKGKGYSKIYFFKIPVQYTRISSKFQRRRWHPVLKRYRAHLGTDFAAPRGRKIYAAGDGRIIFRGRKGGYGNTIIINHGNGYRTLYAHQNRFKGGLRRGSYVRKGTHIGYVGSTGLSSGPHLHLGLYKNGRAINPLKVIKRGKEIKLRGKAKKTFIANAKNYISDLNIEIKNKQRALPTNLTREETYVDIKQ